MLADRIALTNSFSQGPGFIARILLSTRKICDPKSSFTRTAPSTTQDGVHSNGRRASANSSPRRTNQITPYWVHLLTNTTSSMSVSWTKAPRNISCITMSSMYTADVSFVNGTQTVDAEVTEGTPMNATFIGYDYLFYSAINSQPWYEPVNFSITQSGSTAMSDEEISAAFNGSQLMAMRDTLINPLKGALTGFGTQTPTSSQTFPSH
jgi:hypothetical protein